MGTTHYNLKQWEDWEVPRRAQLNEALGQIDQALGDKCEVVFGKYTGNGTATRAITLGFQPSALLLECRNGKRASSGGAAYIFGGLALPGSNVYPEQQTTAPALSITSNGFQVAYNVYMDQSTNESGLNYHYIAFR